MTFLTTIASQLLTQFSLLDDYRELVVEQPALLSLFSLNLDELKLRSRKPQV